MPASIYSGSTKAYEGTPKEAALSFLADNISLFGDLSQLRHEKTVANKNLRHVTFQQTVDGVPVYETGYTVHLLADGRVSMANGKYFPNLDISTTPSISSSNVAGIAKNALQRSDVPGISTLSSELVLYPDKENVRLAWNLVLHSKDPLIDKRYFVDAHSGEVFVEQSQIFHTIGEGNVYPTHPGLSSVTNVDLYRLNGNSKLDGTYAKILNNDGAEAYDAAHQFNYPTSSTHFDEANLYYHIDRFRHEFIDAYDTGDLSFDQITATAHAYDPDPTLLDRNAWFSHSTKELYFGDGASASFSNNFALEDKVIYHEYSHAVIYYLKDGDLTSGDNEEGAINEGVPDFWAGSYTGRTEILDHAASIYSRDMASPDITSYSQYESEEPVPAHDGGEFISSVLWDLGGTIGFSTLDDIVYNAIIGLDDNPNFLELRDMLMTYDNADNGGANVVDIQNTFAEAGIGEFYPPDVDIDGPSTMLEHTSDTFSADVSGGEPPYSYQWYYKRESEMTYTIAVGETSSTYNHTAGEPGGEDIKVVVIDDNGADNLAVHEFIIYGFN